MKVVILRVNSGVYFFELFDDELFLLDVIVNVFGMWFGKVNESLKFYMNINLVFLIMLWVGFL